MPAYLAAMRGPPCGFGAEAQLLYHAADGSAVSRTGDRTGCCAARFSSCWCGPITLYWASVDVRLDEQGQVIDLRTLDYHAATRYGNKGVQIEFRTDS